MGTKDNMEDAVKGTGKDVSDAKYEHSKKAKALKEFNERMAAPAKHEAKAREDAKLAEAAHAAQIDEARRPTLPWLLVWPPRRPSWLLLRVASRRSPTSIRRRPPRPPVLPKLLLPLMRSRT